MKNIGRLVIALGSLVATAAAQVILNFDDLSLPDFGDIPASYGDGLDPNIPDLQYRTFSAADGTTLTAQLDFWNNDYGDLTKIAFASSDGNVAEITFVPAPGYGVRLISFDMAGWLHQNRTNTIMRLVDVSGNVLLDFAALGPVLIQGDFSGPQHSTFTPDLTHFGTVRLQWGTDWNIGLDNVRFQAVIPEPSTWTLLALGVATLTFAARRRFLWPGW